MGLGRQDLASQYLYTNPRTDRNNPGPGEYKPNFKHTERRLGKEYSLKASRRETENFLNQQIKATYFKPGPGMYDIPSEF